VLVGVVAPAAADDLYTLEEWFSAHGYDEAWLEYNEGYLTGDGIVFTLFYASDAESERSYHAEADRAAGEIWRLADYRVVKIEVEASRPTSWSGRDLPASVAYQRSDLEERFGPRPAALDANGRAELANDFSDVPPPEVFALVGGFAIVCLVFGVLIGWLVTFLVLRRRREPVGYAGWTYPPAMGPPPPGQPGWPPAAAPGQQGWPPAPPSGPAAPTPPADEPRNPWTMGPGGSA